MERAGNVAAINARMHASSFGKELVFTKPFPGTMRAHSRQ